MRIGLNSLNIKIPSIRLSFLLVLSIFLISCSASVASETRNAKREVLQHTPRAVGETIIKKSGINSAQAVIFTKVTIQDVEEHCNNWFDHCKIEELSSDPELKKPPRKYTPNCIANTVTLPFKRINDFSFSEIETSTFSYQGVYVKEGGSVIQKWKNIANGEIMNDTLSSEYWPIRNVYLTLCPLAARNAEKEENEFEKRRQLSDEKNRVAALETKAQKQRIEAQTLRIKAQFAQLSRTDQKAIINIIGKYDVAANSPKFLFASKAAEAKLDLNNFKIDHPELKDSDLVRMLDSIKSTADTEAILFIVFLEYAKRALMP